MRGLAGHNAGPVYLSDNHETRSRAGQVSDGGARVYHRGAVILDGSTEVHLWDGLWVHLSPGQFGLPGTLLDLSLDLETSLVWGLDDQLCCTWLSEKLCATLEPWLARVRGLRSLSVRAQSKSVMLVVDGLLEHNANTLTRLEYNTGE